MKEVTKEEFYGIINTKKLDVCVSVAGNYPFTNYFKFRHGTLFGVIKPTEIDPKKYPYPWYKYRYYINV